MASPITYVADQLGNIVRVKDVPQIDPKWDARFGGCLPIVSKVRSWGVQGYASIPDARQATRANNRVATKHMVRISSAEWVVEGTGRTDDEQTISC